ncbi:hypothetical protein [Actinomadura formosensis]|uniref:hypothetical protein n=1 Tax=Actinomadura formosensis TaxID=60706 RepID=UPI000AD86A77|nr:hypothetical protein [Actinomadura formosensis]
MLRVMAAAIKVVWASRRSFDRFDDFDDLMSALRPLKPPVPERPSTGREKAGVFPTSFPETRLTGFTQVPHVYAQHVDNSVDNS